MTTKNQSKGIEEDEEYIYAIIEQLDGLELPRADELLRKTIMMLAVANSPIRIKKIEEAWFPKIKQNAKKNAMMHLTYGQDKYECIANNKQLYIYIKTSLWYSKLLPNQCLYYVKAKKSPIQLRRLTKENLLNDYRITPFEDVLINFLKDHSPYKKHRNTKNFELLEVLDEKRVFADYLK